MQASYFFGYFPKPWKKESRIYLRKPDKESYTLTALYLSNILDKIYERIILQQATNILEENKFFKGKNLYAYQKNKNALQAPPIDRTNPHINRCLTNTANRCLTDINRY